MTALAHPVEPSDALVLRRDQNGVARLTLNRPAAYNALSMEAMEAMLGMLVAIDLDPSIKVVVIEGSGKGFCAGHDLKQLQANPDRAYRARTFETCSKMMIALTKLRQPVIAKVHGIATAAGCQLVATCDLAVAADSARFGTPGVNIGLFCSTPLVALSRAVHRKQAMEMLLTGEMIPAAKAVEIGLINRAVPEAELEEAVDALARKIARNSGLVLKTGKDAFYSQIDLPLAEAYAHTAEVMTENMSFDDAAEGIAAFVEKRKPVWRES
ncbi:MAG: enoyl-CoA hydratase [Alphaproteobacteria bacterium]|nr:enoyl-CoA hydratase [Alphaproteobacteria bacterium]